MITYRIQDRSRPRSWSSKALSAKPSAFRTPRPWWWESSSAPRSSCNPRESPARVPSVAVCVARLRAHDLSARWSAPNCRRLSAHRRCLCLSQRGLLSCSRISLGLGDVLEHAFGDHRRHRGDFRPIRGYFIPLGDRGPGRRRGRDRALSAVNLIGVRQGTLFRRFSRRQAGRHRFPRRPDFARRRPARPLRCRRRGGPGGAHRLSGFSGPSGRASSPSAAGTWSRTTAEETRDPHGRSRARWSSATLIVTACYIALNAVYLYVLPARSR